MINPASIMKIMKAIIEITVTKPGEEPITTNMKVQQSDLELLQELQDIAKM